MRSLLPLTVLHATVDALCACCVFVATPGMDYVPAMTLFVAYNVLAFLTQPLVGLWLDRRPTSRLDLLLAVALLLCGGGIGLLTAPNGAGAADASSWSWMAFAMTVLIGLGNSLFHVYGGIVVAHRSGNDARQLGVYVSSGALGLLLGGMYATGAGLCCIMTLLVALTALYILFNKGGVTASPVPLRTSSPSWRWLLAFIVLIVFIRSFVGSIRMDGAASVPYYAVLATLLAVVGKAGGGFVARRFGIWTTMAVALLVAGVGFLLGACHAEFLLVMVLALNLTMPLTLHEANRLLPRREGYAFGLLAAMLAPGVGLALLFSHDSPVLSLLYPLIATLIIEALTLLAMGVRRWQVLGMSVVMNVLTNVTLNSLVLFAFASYPSTSVILLLELTICLVEALLYRLVTDDWRTAFTYSLTCNAVSYGAGLLFATVAL